MVAPNLFSSLIMAEIITLFSGMGGVETGAIAAGIEPIASVELDPTHIEYSLECRAVHAANFPNSRFHLKTVEEIAFNGFIGLPRNPWGLWASPPCTHYSKGGKRQVQRSDLDSAIAVCKAIATLKPKNFFLENIYLQ